METMEITKTQKVQSNSINDLVKAFNELVSELKDKVDNTTYSDEPVYRFTHDIKEISASDLSHIGIRDIKRFKRYLNQAMYRKSLRSINRLFNLVYKKFLGIKDYPRLVCDKHEIIQKLRKEWKRQQVIADQLLKQYKNEKGDFYKVISL